MHTGAVHFFKTFSFSLNILTGSKWGLWQHLWFNFSLHCAHIHIHDLLSCHVTCSGDQFKWFYSAYKLCSRRELKINQWRFYSLQFSFLFCLKIFEQNFIFHTDKQLWDTKEQLIRGWGKSSHSLFMKKWKAFICMHITVKIKTSSGWKSLQLYIMRSLDPRCWSHDHPVLYVVP